MTRPQTIDSYSVHTDSRHLEAEAWRCRVEEVIRHQVATAAEETFLVQVSENWVVQVSKERNGKKAFTWIELRARIDLNSFFFPFNDD